MIAKTSGPNTLNCEEFEFIFCAEHFCGPGTFPCGDGICSDSLWTKPRCHTGRDANFVRKILATSKNDADSCWNFAICQLGFTTFFPNVTPSICSRSECQADIFLFPTDHAIVHPDVRFVYRTRRNFSRGYIQPDYVCYNVSHCKSNRWNLVEVLNRTCIQWNDIDRKFYHKSDWDELIFSLSQKFASCFIAINETKTEELLFHCGSSFFISKNRLNDGSKDCPSSIDESLEHDTCSLKLANRFQCQSSRTQCIPRLFLADLINDCKDQSDEDLFYRCNSYSVEAGCKWKRGFLENLAQFQFFSVCNGFVEFVVGNITDEDGCPSNWIARCNSSLTRCDGYWDCQDGHDEHGCPRNKYIPCNETSNPFYCMNRTTGEYVCYSSDKAGDGREDCVGAIDERVGGYCHHT